MRLPGVVVLAIAVSGVTTATQQPTGPPQPTSPTQTARPGAPSPSTVTPPRDPRSPGDQKKGTAILRGYVVAADTGNPVRRATVRVSSPNGSGNNVTSTDADGRWEVKDLTAGSYMISVQKPGYVPMSYGQRSATQMGGRPLDILDGQLVEKIGFSLPRGGVITGRLTDDFGDPIAGAQVSAVREQFAMGSRRMFPAGSAQTDDLGAYRIYGLPPGDYYVTGVLRQPSMGMPGQTVTETEGFATTYYPGTTSPAQGQRVTVRASQEVQNVSFALSATRLTTIKGRVVSSSNEPVVNANVRVSPADRNDPMSFMMFNMAMTRGDGSFQITGMTPGNYVLAVIPRNPADSSGEFGQLRLTVGGDSIDNVLIVTGRGAVLQGTITTDEGVAPPVRPAQVSIFARAADPMLPTIGPMMPPKVNDDWTFELTGLGEARIIGAGLMESPDWILKGVYHNGTDVTDTPIEFSPGQTVQGVEIVFSRRRTELSGMVTMSSGKPDLDVTVVAFAQDARRLTPGSRFIRSGRPNQDGRYTIRGLPPEDYFVAVVREVEPGRLSDPEYLETLRDSAVRVTLAEGETRAQDFKAPPRQ